MREKELELLIVVGGVLALAYLYISYANSPAGLASGIGSALGHIAAELPFGG